MLSKILSLLFGKRNSDKGYAPSPEDENSYDEWEGSSEELLLATKRMLEKSGGDTSKIDALLKKYHNY